MSLHFEVKVHGREALNQWAVNTSELIGISHVTSNASLHNGDVLVAVLLRRQSTYCRNRCWHSVYWLVQYTHKSQVWHVNGMNTLYNNVYLSDAVHHVRPVIKSLDILECAGVAIFTARRSYASAVLGVVILSLSVRPSHACFVTNPKNLPAIFLYHMKGQSF